MILLCIVLLLPALLTSLLSYSIYCYEEANQSQEPIKKYFKLSCRAFPQSIFSGILLMLVYPLGIYTKKWRMPSHSTKPLVILVHGLFHNSSAWIYGRHKLHKAGFATACFQYPSRENDFTAIENKLLAYLRTILAANPQRKIHLVGHSLGGLLLRSAVWKIANIQQIQTLTTLGTPFSGSKMSPFALNTLGKSLQHQGSTVRRITQAPFPEQIRGYCIKSPADNMVLPLKSLNCPIPSWTTLETKPISHLAMLFSRQVYALLCTILRTPEPKTTNSSNIQKGSR